MQPESKCNPNLRRLAHELVKSLTSGQRNALLILLCNAPAAVTQEICTAPRQRVHHVSRRWLDQSEAELQQLFEAAVFNVDEHNGGAA